MTAVTADFPSRSLSVCPNTYQFPCSTLTSLIQPQSRHHCRKIRSPNTRHKSGCFTDLEKQEKALVNQTTCQSRYLTVNVGRVQYWKWFLLLHRSYQCEWRCIGKRRMWRNMFPICIIFRQHNLLQLPAAQPPPLTPCSRIAGFAHAENTKFQEQELHFTGKEELLRFSRKIKNTQNEHSVWLPSENKTKVIGSLCLESIHPVCFQNPADRGQGSALKSAISSRGVQWNPRLQCSHSAVSELGASGGSCKPGLGERDLLVLANRKHLPGQPLASASYLGSALHKPLLPSHLWALPSRQVSARNWTGQ